MDVDPKKTNKLLGLFENDDCMFNIDIQRQNMTDLKPTLTEMLDKAIDILKNDENGFFLFVEAGRIDHAHHQTRAHLVLGETEELSKAVALAKRKLSEDDTLFVVTADHSHTMSYAGYGVRPV